MAEVNDTIHDVVAIWYAAIVIDFVLVFWAKQNEWRVSVGVVCWCMAKGV